MQRLASILSFAALTAVASAQFSIVIPNGMAAAEGSTSNAFPWGRGGTGIRIQTIYDSANFTAQGVTFPVIITGLRWRPNTNVALSASTYPATNNTVKLSTCPVDQAAVTTAFANQIGTDETTCFSGPVAWAAQPAQAGPTPFGISVPFTTNFLYDPSLGDLNIECEMPVQVFSGAGPQLDVHGVTPLASRAFLTTAYTPGGATATGITLNHGVVVEVSYTPAAGLYSGFTANVTAGASPLAVNFTDATFTSDPAGITSWAWDLDGDNVIDSTVQNPSFVYTGCGNYNVTLTTTDATHPPSTLTRTAYIKTDEIAANFTYALLAAPNVFQFTDTTTPAATAWDWDFNGDNITDSTAQNPVWLMPLCQSSNVRLIATRNCRTSTKAGNIFIAPNTLSTLFNGGNSGAALWTVYFDINVTNPQGINICGLATNSTTAANTAFSLDAYVTPGTYLGKEVTPAAWHSAGNAAGVTAGANVPSLAGFATPVYLPFGSYGLALRYNAAAPAYTNGPLGPYSNADMTLTLGASRATTTAPFTGGTNFTPRVWNGSIFYDTATTAGIAGYGFFGQGCAGSMGVPRLVNSGRPQFGTTLSVTITNVPASAAIMMTGFSNTTSVFGPLPVDTTPYGAPGCFGRVSTDAVLFLAGAANSVVWSFPIPSDPGLAGLQMYNQAVSLDPGFNALGATLSDAHAMLIGF